MSDPTDVAGWILVIGTVVGIAPIAHPALVRIWSMPREQHQAVVAQHRVVWASLNAGFVLATIATTVGLVIMSGALFPDTNWGAAVLACGIAYGFGGVLWCVELAIRTRTTPALAELGPDMLTTRGLKVFDAAMAGLFNGFVVITGISLAVLGLVLLLAGGVLPAIAVATFVVGAGALVWLGLAGDVIPAVLYLPTLLIGIGLLAGWS